MTLKYFSAYLVWPFGFFRKITFIWGRRGLEVERYHGDQEVCFSNSGTSATFFLQKKQLEEIVERREVWARYREAKWNVKRRLLETNQDQVDNGGIKIVLPLLKNIMYDYNKQPKR